MKAGMNKKALVLLLEGVLCSAPVLAEDVRYCQTDTACAPCERDQDGKQREACRSVHGKRIDRGASLGSRLAGPDTERELGTETFVLSDANLRQPLQPQPKAAALTDAPSPAPAVTPPAVVPAPLAPQSIPGLLRTEKRMVERSETRPGERAELAPASFISGGSELSPLLQKRLDELVAYLKPYQNIRIQVTGHTDTQRLSPRSKAKYRDNQGLGQARADIVAGYLGKQLALSPERISTASRGPDQPIAGNDTLAGMAQNRRVEIRVWFENTVVIREEVEVPLPPLPAPAPEPVAKVAPPPVPEPILAPPEPPPALPAPLRSCQEVLAARTRAEDLPFRISIDGVPQDEPGDAQSGTIDPDIQRCTDVALEKADIQIRYDSLDQTPVLNAHAWPNAVARDAEVTMTGWSNYAAFIQRAEIRVFAAGASLQGTPLAVLPLQLGEPVRWAPNGLNGLNGLKDDHVQYVLRVYDSDGRFDETRSKRIELTDRARPAEPEQKIAQALLAGYGENSLAIHNIQVRGGAVTVNGKGIRAGERVSFLGQTVPLDTQGTFAARQILPAGSHVVEVSVHDAQGATAHYARNLSIAADDWFYLGIADLTLGRNSTSGPAKLVTADATDHFDNEIYVDGRLAFYLKGKIKGEWLLTASADTREQPLKNLFSNFTEKDPRYLLRSLDPDRYYPVYGDDSTTVDDAPTQGKFFVKLARGDSQVMWGSFKTSLTGTEFANFNRALYGARARLVSDEATRYGEKVKQLEVFAADPGTLQAREEFRGTGGSLYYLQNMDLTPGSERVWIEIRDKDSGVLLKTQQLVAVQDYELNAIQGRISLRTALASTAGADTLVQAGDLSGHPVYLVATYEYAPGVSSVESMVVGGRASAWVNDHLQVGASGYRQDGPRQRLHGLDATLRYKPGTYIKVEGARTDGAGTGSQTSLDGGFSFNPLTSTGGRANAERVEAAVDFADVGEGKSTGKATYFWQNRDAGFSAPGQISSGSEAIRQQGASVAWQATENTELRLKADVKNATSQDVKAAEVNVSHRLNPNWKAGVGVRADDMDTRTANASPTLSQDGSRTDAVLRMDYTPDEASKAGWSAYGYLQGTLKHDGTRNENDRFGLGGEKRINDRFKLLGEISDGDGGVGAKLGGDWQVDDRSSLYTNYALTPDRTDDGFHGRAGLLTLGGRTRYTDALSLNAEERYQHGDGPAGLIHAFGLDFSPDERWSYGVKMESGKLSDPAAGDMDRKALGLSLGYRKDATRYAGAMEYRHENSTTGTRKTWLMKNTLGYQVNPDWRFLGRLNFSTSQASGGAFQDGDFIELVTGYAWRPVNNDRWNTLFKYTYLYNLPSAGQLSNGLTATDYSQRSHVLSVDTIHDLRPWLSLGGKLGLRRGEMKDNDVPGSDWIDSTAWLAIVRADWHWVHEWDIVTELRRLDARDAGDAQDGALVAVYRHLNKHVKLGAGYNFTNFSDDLTDMSYRSHGWFINLIGKM